MDAFRREGARIPSLNGAILRGANLSYANLNDVNLSHATFGETLLGSLDLSRCSGLESAIHESPSTIGIDTLYKSGGKIPEVFLRGCGLSKWEVAMMTLYDRNLSDEDTSELVTTKLCAARMQGPLYIGGVFISYSRRDSVFAEKLRDKLYDEGASPWLDSHDLNAGRVDKQINRSMRLQDIVVVVLSEQSLASDWVWQEVEWARKKEKDEGRDVLCPIALDGTWKTVGVEPVLMRQLKQYNVLDFAGWKTRKFDEAFRKLVNGMKHNYESRTAK